MRSEHLSRLGRRAFLYEGALVMASFAAGRLLPASAWAEETPALRIGLMTDIHYADVPAYGTRYYRESIAKIREAVVLFNRAKVDFSVELGDYIDAAETLAGEIIHLRTIDKEYARLACERHYVIGNHCVWNLTKNQFLENCGAKQEHYSFDSGNFHFVVLDACYRQDGVPYGNRNSNWLDANIPPPEQAWLQQDLKTTTKPTLVFVHQRLDIESEFGIRNAPTVRRILEKSGRVLAVFQGHNHINDYKDVGGIHYCTLTAMVEGSGMENNAYAVLCIYGDRSLRLEGFRQQKTYPPWKPSST
jgi:alkaline phosphatase